MIALSLPAWMLAMQVGPEALPAALQGPHRLTCTPRFSGSRDSTCEGGLRVSMLPRPARGMNVLSPAPTPLSSWLDCLRSEFVLVQAPVPAALLLVGDVLELLAPHPAPPYVWMASAARGPARWCAQQQGQGAGLVAVTRERVWPSNR